MLEYKISVFQKLFLQILHDALTQKHVLLKKEVYNLLYKFPLKNVTITKSSIFWKKDRLFPLCYNN